jgi:hypothetical protein
MRTKARALSVLNLGFKTDCNSQASLNFYKLSIWLTVLGLGAFARPGNSAQAALWVVVTV